MSLIELIIANHDWHTTTVLHLKERHDWIEPRADSIAHILANVKSYLSFRVISFSGNNIEYVYVDETEEERLDHYDYILRTAGHEEAERYYDLADNF